TITCLPKRHVVQRPPTDRQRLSLRRLYGRGVAAYHARPELFYVAHQLLEARFFRPQARIVDGVFAAPGVGQLRRLRRRPGRCETGTPAPGCARPPGTRGTAPGASW